MAKGLARPWEQTQLSRRHNLDQHRLRAGAVTDRQRDATKPAGDHQQRRAVGVDSLIETIATLPDDGGSFRETDLAAVSMTRERERHATRLGLVKEIRIVRE